MNQRSSSRRLGRPLLATTVLIATALLSHPAAAQSTPVSAPPPATLWRQVQTLLHHGKLLEGSHQDMFGSRMADYYTTDRANAPALAAATHGVASVTRFPAGSLLIKENFDETKKLGSITAMLKLPGYDPANRNWVMAMFSPTGKAIAYGKVASCDKCHSIAGSSDFVFPPLQHLPPMVVMSFFPGQKMSPAYLKLLDKDQ